MGRLSAYAKNRILKLRFKKNKRIIHIVEILKRDDNIKVSRQAVSTFLKKYLETNSIYDKPRTGRKRKLTQEEIQLIGQVTRLNRDITARAIKEYLNLNVSTYTILRATKLFEWNKINPNSNDSKKAAALERQLNGELKQSEEERSRSISANGKKIKAKRKSLNGDTAIECKSNNETLNSNESLNLIGDEIVNSKINKTSKKDDSDNNINDMGEDAATDDMAYQLDEIERIQSKLLINHESSKLNSSNIHEEDDEVVDDEEDETIATGKKGVTNKKKDSSKKTRHSINSTPELEKVDLHLIEHKELLILKNLSCSPMSFATKILFKIFKIEELHGHNVSGKTLNKNLKMKLPLDPVRIGYIKFLVEKYYDEQECKEMLSGAITHKQDLWKSCHTAINKSILISERKAAANTTASSSSNLNASNLTNNRTSIGNIDSNIVPPNKKTRKTKYENDSSSSDDDETMMPCNKKITNNKNSANTASGVLGRNKAVKKSSGLNGSLKQTPQKRMRRFKSDDSSSSSSSFDFEDDLLSEDVDSSDNDDNAQQSNDSDDSEKELKPRKLNKVKDSELTRRNYKRQRKSSHKMDDDEAIEDDDEDDCQNEIELIQNIENRLVNINKHSSSPSQSNLKLPIYMTPTDAKMPSSEASAAANIAAAMKKQFVVIGADTIQSEIEQKQDSTAVQTHTQQQSPNTQSTHQTNDNCIVTKSKTSVNINSTSKKTPLISKTGTSNQSNTESSTPNSNTNTQRASRSSSSRNASIQQQQVQTKSRLSVTTQIKKECDTSPQAIKKEPKKTPTPVSTPITQKNQTEPQRITRSSTRK